MNKFSILSLLLLLSSSAFASSFSIDLTSPAYFDRTHSTGFWDFSNGQIRAPYAASGTAGKEIYFGDGSDGAFNDGPAQTGISVSGNNITIDTSVKSTFQFTSFTLGAGKTITVIGPQSLTTLVLGATSISGTVSADGGTGVGNASPPASGGSAGPGGSKGGTGGVANAVVGNRVSATSGLPLAGIPLGGGIGTNQTGASNDQGGGGGCNGKDAVVANSATAGNGGLLANNADCTAKTYATLAGQFESSFVGGAGGGGGGAFSNGVYFHGGGGGGGGGAIHLTSLGAINVAAGANITAKGGIGGNYNLGNAADCGGGGGGGSGGSVWLQTASTVSGAGVIDISGGVGGSSTSCTGLYDGGTGSRGVARADTSTGALTPTSTPAASINANTVTVSTSQTYTVVSKPIDMTTGYYALSAPVETVGCGAAPAAGTLTVTYEGSMDGVTFEHPVPKDRITELNDYSFIRFNVAIVTTTATPPCLTGLSIPYELREASNINLKGGLFCGSINSGGTSHAGKRGNRNGSSPLAILGDLFMIALAVWLSYRLPSARRSSPSY